MNPRFQLDQSEFTDTLKRVADLSGRKLGDFLTSRLYHISKEARDQTPIASRTSITSYLGATLSRQKLAKNGKVRRTYAYHPTPVVYAIINARRRMAGLDPLERGQMASAAKKFIASKLRAVGSLRNGWSRGIGILAKAVREPFTKEGPPIKLPSDASPAKQGFRLSAMINYRVTVPKNGGGREVDPRVMRALESGFAKENREMIKHLDAKMNEIAKQAGAI
jgi:hypothetical protein